MDYQTAGRSSALACETNDCVVRAITVATDQNYDFVRGLCQMAGRKPKNGTPFPVTKKVLYSLGYIMRTIVPPAKTVAGTVKKLDKNSICFVWTKEHVACWRDGKLSDWKPPGREKVERVSFLEKETCSVCGSLECHLMATPPEDWETLPATVKKWIASEYSPRYGPLKIGGEHKLLCCSCANKLWGDIQPKLLWEEVYEVY